MKKVISVLVAVGAIALGGCTAINQQLDKMEAEREAGEKRQNDLTFKHISDRDVAKTWYPEETFGLTGAKLVRMETATVEYVLEGASTTNFDQLSKPLVEKYLADVKQRGGIVKAYKTPLHARTARMLEMWRTKADDFVTKGNRDYINGAGNLYIEYSATGEMRSALLRTGYGVIPQGYAPIYERAYAAIVFGPAIKRLESQLKNSELKDAEIGGAL